MCRRVGVRLRGKRDESTDDFRAWVSRIAANASIDLLRQRRDAKMASLEEPIGLGQETLGKVNAFLQLGELCGLVG